MLMLFDDDDDNATYYLQKTILSMTFILSCFANVPFCRRRISINDHQRNSINLNANAYFNSEHAHSAREIISLY